MKYKAVFDVIFGVMIGIVIGVLILFFVDDSCRTKDVYDIAVPVEAPATVDPVLIETHEEVAPVATDVEPVVAPPDKPVDLTGILKLLNEDAAYAKADANFMRAQCLRVMFDWKVSFDQLVGEISDLGNLRGVAPCQASDIAELDDTTEAQLRAYVSP